MRRPGKNKVWSLCMLVMLLVCTCTGCGTTAYQGSADTVSGGVWTGQETDQEDQEATQEDQQIDLEEGQKEPDDADAEVSAFSLDKNDTELSGKLQVWFLDVGQGSSALIRQGTSYMLVDGGDREYSSYVVSFLKEQGVEKLDYVVISHYDSDHLNGVLGALHAFDCQKILAPDYQGDTKLYESFVSVVGEQGLLVEYPVLGDTYQLGDASFRVVSPGTYSYQDPNSNSLGIRLEYGENSFLFCGDCTQESEEDLLYLDVDLDSDVMAANHHGSQYSNSSEFLEAVSPSAVVISCGLGNSYGHPAASVLLGVQKLGADLFRTDLQGVIEAVSDGKQITFSQEPSMDYRSGTELDESAGSGGSGVAAGSTGSESGTGQDSQIQDGTQENASYVLNNNSSRFHLPSCSSVDQMNETNRIYSNDTREQLIQQGYTPCKRCNP